jgi:hypothetical protein
VIFAEFVNITPYFANPFTLRTRNQEMRPETLNRTLPSLLTISSGGIQRFGTGQISHDLSA